MNRSNHIKECDDMECPNCNKIYDDGFNFCRSFYKNITK